MASKLKIIVDYPCDVYCDYDCKGQATPDSIFSIELRKGTYYLEFIIEGEVRKRIDYTIETNDEEDLLRIHFSSVVAFGVLQGVFFNLKSKPKRDVEPMSYFSGKTFVRCLDNEERHDISWNNYIYTCIDNTPPSSFDLIFEEEEGGVAKTFVYKLEVHVPFIDEKAPKTVLIDYNWLHCHHGTWYGKFAIYLESIICIYYVENSKVERILKIDAEAGFLYSIAEDLALTVKNDKFGIYDINKNAVVCPNKYEGLYYQWDVPIFVSNDKYTAVLNDKKGVVNRKGEVLVPFEYDEANPCSIGYIVKKDNLWGLSREGECPKEWYDEIFAVEQSSSDGTFHIHAFDRTKELIEEDSYCLSCILYFKKNDKFGYWNVLGQQSKTLYDEIESQYVFECTTDRLIKTRIGTQFGYIDCFGQVIIPCKYEAIDFARNLFVDDYSVTIYCDKKLLSECGIKSKFISKYLENPFYYEYHDTAFIAKSNGKFGVITLEGKTLISFEYDSIKGIEFDCYLVKKNGLFGILKNDKEVRDPVKYTDENELLMRFLY